MDSRTFRADNMLAALEIVKKEMGPEAIIVSARNVLSGPAWQVWKKPQIEIVAIRKGDKAETKSESLSEKLTAKGAEPGPKEKAENTSIIYKNPFLDSQKIESTDESFTSRAEELLSAIRSIGSIKTEKASQKTKESGVFQKTSGEQPDIVRKIHSYYLNFGIEKKLLDQIANHCCETLSPQALKNETKVLDNFRIQLEASIRTKKLNPKTANVIFLVGASGSGRTSMIAKLSIYFANQMEKKVGWICTDTVRIGAISEARTYTDTIGLPLKIAYTPEDLKQAVQDLEQEIDIFLVDTPAINPFSEMSIVELGSFLTAIPTRSTWMMIPATSTARSIELSYSSLSSLRPNGFVLNRLDETDHFSEVFNLAWRTQIPLFYFSYGASVIGNVVEAKSESLVRAILEEKIRI
jgi:flagellar biosynthesis protein FlhF